MPFTVVQNVCMITYKEAYLIERIVTLTGERHGGIVAAVFRIAFTGIGRMNTRQIVRPANQIDHALVHSDVLTANLHVYSGVQIQVAIARHVLRANKEWWSRSRSTRLSPLGRHVNRPVRFSQQRADSFSTEVLSDGMLAQAFFLNSLKSARCHPLTWRKAVIHLGQNNARIPRGYHVRTRGCIRYLFPQY